MTPRDHARACDLFAQALEQPEHSRSKWLRAACADEPELLAAVQAMLDVDQCNDGFLEPPSLTSTQEVAARMPLAGFEIVSELGRGGMGTVYRARKRDGVDRHVALKVLGGFASAAARERFRSEIESLSTLQHDNIAKVFEVGAGVGPEQWFTMELIEGVPISQHCDDVRATTTQRIELFLGVCAGVEHAHRNGVLHRDLKPSNILVHVDGETATPKIIDFGIAKNLSLLEGGGQRTVVGVFLGTPTYAAPEQIAGASDIDTRADVYSLGVLLYELLVGALPLETLDVLDVAELQRRVSDTATERPSTRITRHVAAIAAQVAERRRTSVAGLRRRLQGDVDWILLKALAKDREARYAGVRELADDLRRHLAGQPVSAGAPGVGYRLRKYVRRHLLALSAVAVVVTSLSVALGISVAARSDALHAQKLAEDERIEAQREVEVRGRVLEFLQHVIARTDPLRNPDAASRTLAQHFEDASRQLPELFAGEPAVEREVRLGVAQALIGMGSNAVALEILDAAFALDVVVRDPLRDLEQRMVRAIALARLNRTTAAHAMLDELFAGFAELHPDPASPAHVARMHGFELALLNLRGSVAMDADDPTRALQAWRRALRFEGRETAEEHRELFGHIHIGVGKANRRLDKLEDATEELQLGVAQLRELLGADDYQVIDGMRVLAGLALDRKELGRAEQLLLHVQTVYEQKLKPNRPEWIPLRQALADLRLRQGRAAEARALLEAAVEDAQNHFGPEAVELVDPLANLGNLRWMSGRLADAQALYRRAIDLREHLRPEPDNELAGLYHDLASIHRDLGNGDKWLALTRRSVAVRSAALGALHEQVLSRRVGLANVLQQLGHYDEATKLLASIDPDVVAKLGPGHTAATISAQLQAHCLLMLGKPEAAAPHLQNLRERAKQSQFAKQIARVLEQLEERLDRARAK